MTAVPGIQGRVNPGNGFAILQIHYTSDPAKATPEWRTNVMRGMPKWAFDREYEIDFDSISGMPVYPEFLDTPSHDGKDPGNVCRPFAIPRYWKRYRAIDPGFRNPFACLWFAVSPIGWLGKPWPTIYIYREHYEAGQRTAYHKKWIHKLTGGAKIVYTVIDPEARIDKGYSASQSRNPDYSKLTYQLEMHRPPFSIPTVPWMRLRSEYTAIERVAKLIVSRQLQIFANCLNTIKEHRTWRWRERPNQMDNNKFEIPVDKDNHTCDCLKMFVNSPWKESSQMVNPEQLTPERIQDARMREHWRRVKSEHRDFAHMHRQDMDAFLQRELGEEDYGGMGGL